MQVFPETIDPHLQSMRPVHRRALHITAVARQIVHVALYSDVQQPKFWTARVRSGSLRPEALEW